MTPLYENIRKIKLQILLRLLEYTNISNINRYITKIWLLKIILLYKFLKNIIFLISKTSKYKFLRIFQLFIINILDILNLT